uniref:Uncharacterized protein n=1 Tax=Arundo donax TaxID=35708 RepID=A0A0A9FTQ9_ARUDO
MSSWSTAWTLVSLLPLRKACVQSMCGSPASEETASERG